MKRTIALTTALLLLAASATAVVGHNSSGGDMHIMGSGSSASAATGPNGTLWTASVSMTGQTQQLDGTGARNFSVSEADGKTKVSFEGTITAPTPCHVLEHDVEERNGTYVIDIRPVESGNGSICAQVVTGISYEASFQAEKPYTLEVRHGGKKVETLKQMEAPGKKPGRKGLLEGLFSWFSRLF